MIVLAEMDKTMTHITVELTEDQLNVLLNLVGAATQDITNLKSSFNARLYDKLAKAKTV